MHLAGLWRYPIKSMKGEPLPEAELTLDGIAGDRRWHVAGPRGVVTGRSRRGLLILPVSTGADGEPLIAGRPWRSAEAAMLVEAVAGPGLALTPYAGPERFDILNLLVATDGAVAALGEDIRRLRPNLLIAGVGAEEEVTWPGRGLAVGETVIGVHSVRERCVVTTVDPDTGKQDVEVLKRINRDFRGELALNCWTITPGTLRVGDPVSLVDTDARPEHVGGWVLGAPYRASPA